MSTVSVKMRSVEPEQTTHPEHCPYGSDFGRAAADYHALRPSYPIPLVRRALVAAQPQGTRWRTALDIGAGTGLLTTALRGCGLDSLGVEIDERMAAVAQNSGLRSVVADFTKWTRVQRYDVVACGQAWHWLPPERRVALAEACRAPRGAILLARNTPALEVAAEMDLMAVYEELWPEAEAAADKTAKPEQRTDSDMEYEDELQAAGYTTFAASDAVERSYTGVEWCRLLTTEGRHLALPAGALDQLLDAIRSVIEHRLHGVLDVTYTCEVVVGVDS